MDEWLGDLRGDAEFNIQTYVDCFLSENLIRKYLGQKGEPLITGVKNEADQWRKTEETNKAKANISFEIRRSSEDLDYLGMDALAVSAEGGTKSGTGQALWKDAVAYAPVRNVVGHTGLLTQPAKNHLSNTYENIKARVRALLKTIKP